MPVRQQSDIIGIVQTSRIEVSVHMMPIFPPLAISIISQSMARMNRNGQRIHPCFTPDLMLIEVVCQVTVTGDLVLDVCVEYLDHIYHLQWGPVLT